MSEATQTGEHGCETCRAKIMRLAATNTHTCDDCGAEWEADDMGRVFPAEA